ncbi:hypothetical protein C8Q75DRAFT_734034 [Abortiporus biennis]|nr:hypothetical protein C8Q75DRAFT_734034 [Abortiporus biennis]
MQFLSTILTFFLFLLPLINAAPASPIGEISKRMTNAQRLSRGLGPAPPVFKRIVPGRDLPTRTAEKRAAPSPSSFPSTYQGKIEVRTTEGHSYGFVINEASGVNGVNFGGARPALSVKITVPRFGSTPVDIIPINPAFPAPHFIGGSGQGISPGVALSNVPHTDAGSNPVNVTESAIWSLDKTTKQITATWIDTDGTKVPVVLGVDLRNNGLFLTKSIDDYNKHSTSSISEVQFFLTN